MNSIEIFVEKMFESPNHDTMIRREKFFKYMASILDNNLSMDYQFKKVRGDGSCFFHAIMRYFGYLVWQDLPNKDLDDLIHDEKVLYLKTIDNLKEMSTEYIREFIGLSDFVLDPNVPEYQLICKFLANSSDLRIIVLEYDGYGNERLNIVSEYVPDDNPYTDTIILLNFSHHFTLIFPKSTDSKFDNKITRLMVGNQIIINSKIHGKLF